MASRIIKGVVQQRPAPKIKPSTFASAVIEYRGLARKNPVPGGEALPRDLHGAGTKLYAQAEAAARRGDYSVDGCLGCKAKETGSNAAGFVLIGGVVAAGACVIACGSVATSAAYAAVVHGPRIGAGVAAIAQGLSGQPETGAAAETAVGAGSVRQVTVLGRQAAVEPYIGKEGFNVLDLPMKGSGRFNWTRNKRFIDDAIERGDEVRLLTSPNEPLYRGGNGYQRELKYLRDRGYTWEPQGDYWVVRPGG